MEPQACPFCGEFNLVFCDNFELLDKEGNKHDVAEYQCHNENCGKSIFV